MFHQINKLLGFAIVIIGFVASTSKAGASEPTEVSMVQLLANPAKFHNQLIQVEGYLHVKFEDECLYLSKEDADYLNGKHGVWISFSDRLSKRPNKDLEYFDCKHVMIIGIFDKDQTGHLDSAAGGIKAVTDIAEQTRWFDGKKQINKKP